MSQLRKRGLQCTRNEKQMSYCRIGNTRLQSRLSEMKWTLNLWPIQTLGHAELSILELKPWPWYLRLMPRRVKGKWFLKHGND